MTSPPAGSLAETQVTPAGLSCLLGVILVPAEQPEAGLRDAVILNESVLLPARCVCLPEIRCRGIRAHGANQGSTGLWTGGEGEAEDCRQLIANGWPQVLPHIAGYGLSIVRKSIVKVLPISD